MGVESVKWAETLLEMPIKLYSGRPSPRHPSLRPRTKPWSSSKMGPYERNYCCFIVWRWDPPHHSPEFRWLAILRAKTKDLNKLRNKTKMIAKSFGSYFCFVLKLIKILNFGFGK